MVLLLLCHSKRSFFKTFAYSTQGERGEEGLVGGTGSTGLRGEAGSTGATGIQGPTGVSGDIGPPGATGPIGSTGMKGLMGAQGPTGKHQCVYIHIQSYCVWYGIFEGQVSTIF